MRLVKSRLPIDAQGVISYTARVNAVRGGACPRLTATSDYRTFSVRIGDSGQEQSIFHRSGTARLRRN
jgi:hypothetical protein